MPFYPVTNNLNGKTYRMPWNKTEEPTEDRCYIRILIALNILSQWHASRMLLKSGWDKLNEPLMDLPSRAAKVVSKPLWDYGRESQGNTWRHGSWCGSYD